MSPPRSKERANLNAAHQNGRQSPRRLQLDEGVLVLPPMRLEELPPGGSIGTFMGVAALRFNTPAGPIAAFLHDIDARSLQTFLEANRLQAERQLGPDYARRLMWWELS